MPRVPRFVWYGLLAVVALLVLAAVARVMLLDPTAHKARVEEAASRVLGMEVTVGGPLALRWRPRTVLVLQDVRARKRGVDIVVAKQAVVGMELLSLLRGQPRVHSIALRDGVLAIERDQNGRFNFQKDTVPGQPRPERDGPDLSFDGATITYADARFDKRVQGRGCRGDLRRIHMAGGDRRFLAGLSFEGEAACDEVRAGDWVSSDVSVEADAKTGVIEFKPVTTRVFDAKSTGRVRADFTGAVPAYEVEHTLRQFPVEHLLKALSLKPVAAGRMDLTARVTMQGRAVKDLQQSMEGTVSLRGQGLTYLVANLDEQFARFESTQTFNLFDVGAMFLVGPAGLLVTKGYEFATVAQGAQGKSEIQMLVSDWTVERGVARTQDVAMATATHRVALKGGVDLVNDRFVDMTIALLDEKGCPKVEQHVQGTLQKPVVEKPTPVEAIAAPAVRLLKKGAEVIAGEKCQVFYAGLVAVPK